MVGAAMVVVGWAFFRDMPMILRNSELGIRNSACFFWRCRQRVAVETVMGRWP